MNGNSLDRRRMLASSIGAAGGLAMFGACRGLSAADTKADKEGWITLFDGQSLDGWHKNPQKIGHGTGGHWHVEAGGVLAGEQDPPGSGNGGILLTDRKFENFELQLDLKPSWGVDSGVFLRCTDKGQCIQMMVDYYNGGNVGQFYGEATGGWGARTFSLKGIEEDGKLVKLEATGVRPPQEVGLVEACQPQEWLDAWKIDDWNTALIRVEGGKYPRITTNINGLQVGVFDAATSQADGYNRDEVAKLLGAEGHVAVQVHGGQSYPEGKKTRWRNIRLRKL
ncbi:MAG: DUF1080 domain-containing protein [Pirellulales bacterium]|nr:DUF1080 domain-containing protein [Pirellulales bacterium]